MSQPKHYGIAEIDITDNGWVESYVENVTKIVSDFGGKYLSRTLTVERLEGERKLPQVFVLIEWPSKEAADAFYNSEAYAPHRKARIDGSKTELYMFPGEDIAASNG
jgi:uncharacterized protein (DUF1330 family)